MAAVDAAPGLNTPDAIGRLALLGMTAIGFDVSKVVQNVDRARHEAEEDECGAAAKQIAPVEQVGRKDQRGEDEHALYPLVRP